MTDEVQQLLREFIVLVFGAVSGFFIQHWRRPQIVKDEHDTYQNQTIQTQGKTLADAFSEIEGLRSLYLKSEKMQRIQWAYIIKLLEGYKDSNIAPPEPPEELKTDPVIMRFVNRDRKQ